jgi:hypothetical protein
VTTAPRSATSPGPTPTSTTSGRSRSSPSRRATRTTSSGSTASTGPTRSAYGLVGIPAVNDLGTVAGLVTGGGSTRLSIFQNGGEDTLISVGSPFDGSTVTGLSFSPEGFNNANQLAFLAMLADGRTVSVIAGLPEPGAASLVLGCAGLLLRRRTRIYRT